MKSIFNTCIKSYSHYLVLLLALVLSGCTLLTENSRDYDGDYILGNIRSNNKTIPENVKITLSLSQNKASGEKEFTLHEYSFMTQTKSLTIPFRLQLPNELSFSSQPLNISVRVEKEGELIMMSDKLTPLLRQSGEKLLLTVNDS
ncbi:TPA: YbaY family lipoprotein [Yersinia enterocolitica]|nr:YbaY family lipoprotein [Yersinia enterocolitica]